jgi:DNA modification methylase
MGAGTTAVASKQVQRNYLGIELNPEYVQISKKRLEGDFLF